LALPFVLGALAAINTWDLPTYLGLMCAAFALARYRAGLRPDSLVKGSFCWSKSGFLGFCC
jgi:uncharacterized membrane protein